MNELMYMSHVSPVLGLLSRSWLRSIAWFFSKLQGSFAIVTKQLQGDIIIWGTICTLLWEADLRGGDEGESYLAQLQPLLLKEDCTFI